MATARKPFVRLETSVLREEWTRDEFATLGYLMCFLGDRWARDRLTAEESAHAVLTPGQLHQITGRSQLVHARRALRALAAHVTLAIRERGQLTEISWLKFPITQELASRGREFKARAKPESAPAPAQAPAGSNVVSADASTDRPPKPKRKKKPPPPGWALDTAQHLIAHLTEVPGARIPKNALMAWAREIELMPHEIPELKLIVMQGGPEAFVQRVRAGIEDATGLEAMRSEDPHVRRYSPQIRCGKSLREKWDQITAAAARRKPRNLSPEDFARHISEARNG